MDNDYILVPYEAKHLTRMELRDYETHELSFGAGVDAYAKAYEQGPGFTLIYKKEVVIAAAGAMILWPGVGEAWFRASDHLQDHKSEVMKACMIGFNVIKSSGFHRIQCVVLKGWDKAITFVDRLGFEYEGEMRMYGPDKRDFLRYAIIQPEE